MIYKPPKLPLEIDLETKPILKKLAQAHRALAELMGAAGLVPNENILVNTLSLQEARDSSAIENIITTQDELFKSDVYANEFVTLAAKEVHNYARALREGFQKVRATGLITLNDILAIQATLEENRAGFRKLPGTELKNERTGATVFTPPQNYDDILAGMANLEAFINDAAVSNLDPLVKMAIVHHQFESIHPFYDGNGRTGRILNILYLVKQGLLTTPVLYLSRYINQQKADYYRLLQAVREQGAWEEWVIYMLEGVVETSRQTTQLVHAIKTVMQAHKVKIRTGLPRVYSQDLLNSLFGHPYSKIAFVQRDLGVTRVTATKYLEALTELGLLHKTRFGRNNYFINKDLVDLLANVQALREGSADAGGGGERA